jgi:hypothetical protein
MKRIIDGNIQPLSLTTDHCVKMWIDLRHQPMVKNDDERELYDRLTKRLNLESAIVLVTTEEAPK